MTRTFPKTLHRSGVWVAVLSLLLAFRLVWVETVETWNSGPLSLVHAGPYTALFFVLGAGLLWLIAVVISAIRARSLGGRRTVALVAVYGVAWLLVEAPYDFWQRLFVERYARAPNAVYFVLDAAAQGNRKTVEAFLAHGISVNARDRWGVTPLHAAAGGGHLGIAEYLLAQGADVNAVTKYGDSPLEVAFSLNQSAMATLLAERGGKRIRGSEEQRKKAVEEITRELMQEQEVEKRAK